MLQINIIYQWFSVEPESLNISKMKILILGQGGREHAIAWKLSRSEVVSNVYVCPGNAGTFHEDKVTNVDINLDQQKKIIDFVKSNQVDLTIVGPEAPLVDGIVNKFRDNGLKIFGPSREFAELEGSKVFSKNFMFRNGIPTANYKEFDNLEEAMNYLNKIKFPSVIKADGLAAGKGVMICNTEEEAIEAIKKIFSSDHSQKLIMEDFLVGQELSAIYVCNFNGPSFETSLPWTKDYKSRDEYNSGPNTGGMGAIIHPILDEHKNTIFKLHIEIEKILIKTIIGINEQLKNTNMRYLGFLYLGLMIDRNNNIKVLEYNCRMGDPETQNLMIYLENMNIDFLKLIVDKKYDGNSDCNLDYINEKKHYSCTLVLAANGYPSAYKKDFYIDLSDIKESENLKIFHAGTVMEDGRIKSIGGRILTINTFGSDRRKCIDLAYENIKKIRTFTDKEFENEDSELTFFREDIGR